ncbi:fumarylacetoacetase [Paramagnetospirillum marisnigri]|uniref:Fumarylacetoacetase n=1 Tax=Paramagnetospirillum marisnigri TaxID=1285242 RepID=A0A178MZQ3_9PROT|nr:fumarylacetoacetate hydrolase family protein [Paramagnetospirillum marisnigri]OAN56041.1 fumarylacetoacetase [Paramagnetospirillum marisnigri]
MSLIFPAPPTVSAPIDGSADRFPIHRIFCVGRNYEAHAKEMGAVADREAPFYFMKGSYAYCPSDATIPYAPGTANLHHEMELVAAIGKAGFRIPAETAADHVFGYACGLDMTRRDLQFAARDKQRPWDFGKNFENGAVLSAIVPATRIGHPAKARITLSVNGQTRQDSDIDQMIHPVPALVAYLSQYYHLEPGDLIYTGTPEGVGPVKAGDRIEGSIDGVGSIGLTIGPAE